MLQYRNMAKLLKQASEEVAEEKGVPAKPIVFSICEWGRNTPHKWGKTAGNMWRTTGDIMPKWWRVMMIYDATVKLYKYASKGHWNDPDMLEVGNGDLTPSENRAHFSLWCMMASPLILGNDLRTIPASVLDIVTNKNMIAIDQDSLGKQAKRIAKGSVDILVKPLSDNSTAICFFNRSKHTKNVDFSLAKLHSEPYIDMPVGKYKAIDMWSDEEINLDKSMMCDIESHDVKVYKLIKIQ